MKVVKIGGGCLAGKNEIERIVDLIAERCRGDIVVVSALKGITDFLIDMMSSALKDEDNIPKFISRIKSKHINIARHLIVGQNGLNQYRKDLNKMLARLERLYYGLNFTKEITSRTYDTISCFGERFSAQMLTTILRSHGEHAICLMPHKIEILTDGKYGDATANLKKTTTSFRRHVESLRTSKTIIFIPGFYGVSEDGDITTFGRGGSDYSAAVVAAASGAELLEIWKDVDGFMSADPAYVPEAQLVPVLSYEEAAELAYFGATILHPRSIDPIRAKKLNIRITNTLNPDSQGSIIRRSSPRAKQIIKSVAYDEYLGILKVFASGVGARPGILAQISHQLSMNGINIRSVVTSQTCISFLLDQKDLSSGKEALYKIAPRPFQRMEVKDDVSLIGIVGDGIHSKKGIAARCFSAVAACDVNVEMISFGPSKSALYFITKKKDLIKAINAIHSTFFSTPRCYPNFT
jgi:bifunctional aspartokinase / homoserine dehydrogenase 1